MSPTRHIPTAVASGIALLAMAVSLAACSGHASPDPTASAQWLAVGRGKVAVAGGMVQVAARTDGVVQNVTAEQGDAVQAGQVLAKLDPRAAKIDAAGAKAAVEQAQAQLAELQVSLQQAERQAPRLTAAAKAGAATGQAAGQARNAVASLKAKRAAAKAALDAARQKQAAAQLHLDATKVRAPVPGTIVSRHVAVGQAVSAASGQPLFELLPNRPHIVRAQVNADAATHIHPGMHAEVVRVSGAGPVYHATVTWVGQVLQAATLAPSPLERALADDVDCKLKLEPTKTGQAPLRIGQRVLVRFPRGK